MAFDANRFRKNMKTASSDSIKLSPGDINESVTYTDHECQLYI